MCNKMKNKEYHTAGTISKNQIPKSQNEENWISTETTKIYDRSLSWLGTCTSMKSREVKLVLWT